MIHPISSFVYPDHHCAQVETLGLPFCDPYGDGPVSFLAFDEAEVVLVKTLGLFGYYDKQHALVLRFPRLGLVTAE